MRTKHLYNLVNQQNNEVWVLLLRYWISKNIYILHQNFRFLMDNRKIKTSIGDPPNHHKDLIDHITQNQQDLLNQTPNTKKLYTKILEKQNEGHNIKGEQSWNNITNKQLDWKHIWTNTFNTYCQPIENDTLYKILHHCLRTNKFIATWKMYANRVSPNCKYCNLLEDIKHIFTDCDKIKPVWNHFQNIYTGLNPLSNFNSFDHMLTLSTGKTDPKTKKLILTITTLIIQHIWKSRNKLQFENTLIPSNKIVNNIKADIKHIINTHFKIDHEYNKLDKFRDKFCIANILCELRNEKVVFKI